MIKFEYPIGAESFDAAAFDQSGAWLVSGNREECEQIALLVHGLYCTWVNGRPVIRFDFEDEPEEFGYCPTCNGSGEGRHDGTTCYSCNGSGEC